jgi:hypothetical protein
MKPLVVLSVALALVGFRPVPAAQTKASSIVLQDLTGSDRGKRLAAFSRYASNGDAAVAQQAIEAAMASDDWLLQAAVLRDVFAKLGSLPVTLSISPEFPRADPAVIGNGRFVFTISRLTPRLMTFNGSLQSASDAQPGGAGTRLGGARRGGGAANTIRGGGAGQLLGTVLTLSELWEGQDPCAMQIALSEPWIMTGRVYCLGAGTYAARADLRTIVPATRPHDEEPDAAAYHLNPGQRPGFQEFNERRAQLAREAAQPRRTWAANDPAERGAIDRDAKVVNEVLGLLRRSAPAEMLGVLEALAADGSSVTSDLALEAGLASSLPAARQFAFHMALARTKALLLVEDSAPAAADGPPIGARFAVVYSEYPIGATLGRNIPINGIAPRTRFSGLLSQFTLDGLLYVPNYTGEGYIRLAIDEFGRIRATTQTTGELTRKGANRVETSYVVPSLIR